MSKTAVIYARVSDRRQAEIDVSIPSQIERGHQKALELGADVLRVFVDEGISGTTDARPQFRAAIEFCELHEPDYFITWSSSRFARNRLDAAAYKARLRRAGVSWVYIAMDVDTDSDSGYILDGLLELMDEHKSRETSRDTKRSMISNAKAGYWNGGIPPFGFTVVPDKDNPRRRRLTPDPIERETVLEIFRMRSSGIGAGSIARQLNAAGRLRRGKRWHKGSILGVLRNEACIGRSIFNRKDRQTGRQRPRSDWVIVESHEPIVPLSMWEDVQSRIANAAPEVGGSPLSNHAFTGLLRCGHCDASMQIETAKGRSRRYSYYRCRRAQRHDGCNAPRIRADLLDAWLIEMISTMLCDEDAIHEMANEMRKRIACMTAELDRRERALRRELSGIKRRTDNLFEILEMHGASAPNMADITRRIRDYNARASDIEIELAKIAEERDKQQSMSIEIDAAALASAIRSSIKEKDPKSLRAFFGSFIHAIRIKGNEITVTYVPDVLLQPQTVHSRVIWLPGPDSNQRQGG